MSEKATEQKRHGCKPMKVGWNKVGISLPPEVIALIDQAVEAEMEQIGLPVYRGPWIERLIRRHFAEAENSR